MNNITIKTRIERERKKKKDRQKEAFQNVEIF